MSVLLTIYTATYNRCENLRKVHNSLIRQTNKNFIWQIIDDGSNDNTREVVQCWMQENNGFEIRYTYKENGGVHTARNLAYQLCDTELIASIDSDDWLIDDAVDKLLRAWEGIDGLNKEYAGIIAKNIRPDGRDVLSNFPSGIREASLQEFVYKYKCNGDKFTMVRADIMKELKPAPVFNGEKLVGEGYYWIQISPKIPFIILNDIIGIIEYLPDGYSLHAYRNVFNNPNGFRAYYRQLIISSVYGRPVLKGIVGYISCSLLLRDREIHKVIAKQAGNYIIIPGRSGLVYLYKY